MDLLVEHKQQLIDMSEILIDKEVLDANEVQHILEHGTLPEPPEPSLAPTPEEPSKEAVDEVEQTDEEVADETSGDSSESIET